MIANDREEHCPLVEEFERLSKSGRRKDAKRMLAAKMREGYNSKPFRAIVADTLDPEIRSPRGRPVGSHLDPFIYEIGQDYDKMIDAGRASGKAYEGLSERYRIGERTLQKIVREYRAVIRASAATMDAWEAEYATWSDEEKREYDREIDSLRQSIGSDSLEADIGDHESELKSAME